MDPTVGLALALALGVAPLPRAGVARVWSPDDGFPSCCPRDLLMADGALWVALGATGSPEGLARIEVASLAESGRDAKLALTRYPHLDASAPADAPPDEVRGMALDRDGALVVASSRGLHRWRPGATGFEPIAAPAPVHALARAADGGLWVSLGGDDGVTAAPLGALETQAGRARCFRPLALLPRSADEAFLVCDDRILHAGPRGAFALELVGTPLRREPTGDDRPPVWITEAVIGGDGSPFVLSILGGLVRVGDRIERVADDGREARIRSEREHQEVMPVRDFVRLLAEPGGSVLVANAVGWLLRWSPSGLERLWPLGPSPAPGREPYADTTPLASTADGVFLKPDPPQASEAPRTIVRLGSGGPVFWRLQRPGTSYADPGVLDVLPDGQGGLFMSTNDGLWHLLP